MIRRFVFVLSLILAASTTTAVHADIHRGEIGSTDPYTNLETWLNDVPPVEVIEFSEFPNGTQIDDEYADLGANFTNGFYTINDASAFLDDWGLDGNNDTIVIEFDQPFNTVGVLFPGLMHLILYNDGELVAWTEDQGGGGSGFFAGLITDAPFDEVWLVDSSGEVNLDNLYFSFEPIPAPGALALLGIAALAGCRRRRT